VTVTLVPDTARLRLLTTVTPTKVIESVLLVSVHDFAGAS
jgi:hypothetical protein